MVWCRVGMAIRRYPRILDPTGAGTRAAAGLKFPPTGGSAPIQKQRNISPTCLDKVQSNYSNYKTSSETYEFVVSLFLLL